MTMKRILTWAVTVFAVMGLASVAFAANTVTMSSDKPNIPYSECEQGGAVTLSMDDGTIMHEGDVLRLTLTNNVTVCGNIDYYLRLNTLGNLVLATGNEPVISTTAGGIIQVADGGVNFGAAAALVSATDGFTYDVGFWVRATDGSRFITLTLAKRALIDNLAVPVVPTVTADITHPFTIEFQAFLPADQMIVKLFDEKNSAAWFFEEADPVAAPNVYDDPITDAGDEGDNVLCIDTATQNFTGAYVYAVPSSQPIDNAYQLTFFGDYIIAQMVSAVAYNVEPACKDDICQLLAIEQGLDQDGEVIDATGIFDFGNYDAGVCGDPTEDRWTSVGLCGSPTLGNGILFSKTGDTFNNGDEFRVTMTVRVGATADPLEAIFSNNALANYWTTSNEQGNCSCSATSVVAQATGVGFAWSGVADQTEIQADFLITPTEDGFGAILFDLPQIDVDVENVAAGQRVYLDVTIRKLPCGIVKSETICLAELIADCPAAAGAVTIDGIAFIGDRQLTNVLHGYLGRMGNIVPTTNLTFPYVPAINDPGFFYGTGY
jgi:hypothetical protein